MDLEPAEITAKCSVLDSTSKLHAKVDKKGEPPSGPLPKPPSASALSNSLDYEAQRNPIPRTDLNGAPLSWALRQRNSNGSSSFADDPGSPFTNGQPRFSRTNGSVASNGGETIGFYGEESPVKEREFATDAPFTVRSSQSEVSTMVDEAKHSQDAADTPEAIAALERYVSPIAKLIEGIFIYYKRSSSSRGFLNADICNKFQDYSGRKSFNPLSKRSASIMYVDIRVILTLVG